MFQMSFTVPLWLVVVAVEDVAVVVAGTKLLDNVGQFYILRIRNMSGDSILGEEEKARQNMYSARVVLIDTR